MTHRSAEGTDKLHAPADFAGPVERRKCTDVFCALLLLLSWLAMTGLGVYAYLHGDYRLVLYPMDYDGNLCGTDYGAIDMTDYPYLYYVNSYSGGVCVRDCPALPGDLLVDVYSAVTYGGVHQTEDAVLPPTFVEVADYSASENVLYCEGDGSGLDYCYPFGSASLSWNSPGINEGFGFAYYAVDTYELFWRCVPSMDAIDKLKNVTSSEGGCSNGGQCGDLERRRFQRRVEDEVGGSAFDATSLSSSSFFNGTADDLGEISVSDLTDLFFNATGATDLDVATFYDDTEQFWNNLFGDLWNSKLYVLGFGFGASLVIGLVYAYLLRIPCLLPFMVWGSIAVAIATFGYCGYYAYNLADKWSNADPQIHPDSNILAATIASYVLWAVSGLLIMTFCCLRKQIWLSMKCVKKTGAALGSMPFIILFPVVQAAGFAGFILMFLVYNLYLASLGKLGSNTYSVDIGPFSYTVSVRDFDYDQTTQNMAWYLLFCLFWTSQFIIAVGEIVIAMSVSKWFFARDKRKVGCGTVWTSLWHTLGFHFGTAAFGSLIVAVVKMVRAFLAKLQKEAKKTDSKVIQAIFCCLQCCMWCFEKCIRFMNKNAYIHTAIFGSSFCTSAREAFFLIARNSGRIAAISYVAGLTSLVGRLFITAVTCGLGYVAIEESYGDQLHSPVGPVFFIGLISFFISGMCMSVFDMCSKTILHCFVADEELGTGYADAKLSEYVDKYGSDEDTTASGGD